MTAIPLDAVCQVLAQIAPLRLAESWDNVGLLIGDRSQRVQRVMTCLTITPAVVEEAVQRHVDLIVTHHPLPFKPLAKLTSDTTTGRMLLKLIAAEVAVYSAHTAFDSASNGINALWAQGLGLQQIAPLIVAPDAADPSVGSGRYGQLLEPTAIDALAKSAATVVGVDKFRIVGTGAAIRKVAIACGSGGSFLSAASMRGCQALITGEATFHICLEAEALGIALVLLGHYASERFAMERIVPLLRSELSTIGRDMDVFVSSADTDPLQSVWMDGAKH
jgi:dinuclear metal center YbgI/SA1388 family protein